MTGEFRGEFEYLSKRQGQIDHGVLAGTDVDGQPVSLTDSERSVHTYVCGVSGSGKSRFLQNLLFQDISKGHPICLIDPMGDLYRSTLDFVAAGVEKGGDLGFTQRELAERYLFLDASDDRNPLRLNPLEACEGETSEQQVDDLMKALERLFEGKLEEQRRLRNVLRAAFMLIAELNRLPADERPMLDGLTQDDYPLHLFNAADILNLPNDQRQVMTNALPKTARLRFHEQYWEFLGANTQREKNQILQSSWNVLQYLLADDLVLRVFDTQRSTFQPSEVLRQGQSLICFLPKNENLAGARFLGKFLTTKLQHAAYRRPEAEWSRPYFLYLDEFHQFVDQSFADGMTNLRKFGVRVTNAHQSQTQPPFDTPEGQSLLRTITANSRVKVLFRLDRSDAERMGQELFALSQQRPNFTAVDYSIGKSEQRSSSVARSSGQIEGTGHSSMNSRASGSSSGLSSREQGAGSDLGGASRTSSSNVRQDQGESHQSSQSTGEQITDGRTEGESRSATLRSVHYSLEGERELHVNDLQRLKDRQCFISTRALSGSVVETPYVPDSFYARTAQDLPAILLDRQRRHLQSPGEYTVRLAPIKLLSAASSEEAETVVVEVGDAESANLQPPREPVLVTVARKKEAPVLAPRPLEDGDPFLD